MSGVRMPLEEKRAIEAWGAKQSPPLTFSGALRYLAQRGLEATSAAPASAAKPAAGSKAASREKARGRGL
jgi:hypothetical protein